MGYNYDVAQDWSADFHLIVLFWLNRPILDEVELTVSTGRGMILMA